MIFRARAQVIWGGELSAHWLKHTKVDGKTHGIFVMDENGVLSPEPEPEPSLASPSQLA